MKIKMSSNNLQFIIDRFYLNKFIKQLDIKNLLDLINNDYNIFKKKIYSPKVKITILKISNILKKYIIKPIVTNEFIFAFNLYKFHYKVLNNENDMINIQDSFELKLNLNNSVIELINYLCTMNYVY